LPLPLSNGVAETAGVVGLAETAGEAATPGARPGAGEVGVVAAVPAGETPPAACPVAAAPVGGGMFFGFSVLIFCFNCASLGTPAQPCSTFG